jgi:hypothetical protein
MRRAVAIVALLVFGAAAQVGVAYGLVFARQWEVVDDPWPRELMMGGWPGPVPRQWNTQPSGIVVHPQRRSSAWGVAWDWQSFQGRGDDWHYELNVWRIGWPVRSLGAYRHVEKHELGVSYGEVWDKRWRPEWNRVWLSGYVQRPAKPGDPPRVWPLYPIVPGFALNTVIYAAALAGVILGAGWAKRRRRRRRGLCEGCGYEVAGLAMCPECGVPFGQGSKAANGQSSK